MKISLRWLNEYLEPGDVSAQEAEQVLTFCGFPIESTTAAPGGAGGEGDVCLDVEVTSNRGDVLSHIGVAREIAASTGRRLKLPASGKVFNWFGEEGAAGTPPAGSGPDVGGVAAVDNRVTEQCPLFTARVIRGVRVGPSPKWLVSALEAVGQRSINAVVDVTNFVALEYGQPSHVFDLATVAIGAEGKHRLIVRRAGKGEKLALLDERVITLAGDEIVVGDESEGAPRAISLAGVMGGSLTAVSDRTTDVLLEAATWDPVSVRRAARRFGIRTDASYRFERTVDARTIEVAARRAAALIVRLAGGKLLPGVIHAGASGAESRPLTVVRMRPQRCRDLLGESVGTPEIQRLLTAHEVQVKPGVSMTAPPATPPDTVLECTIPAHRPDLEREIDLIEEVARTHGLDKLPVHEKMAVRVAGPQVSERAVRELGAVLTGLGFYEAITFTFVSTKVAAPFVPKGLSTLEVCDGRRAADPVLRPSALCSLLACRRANQDGKVRADGDGSAGVRLFEISSVFAEHPAMKKGERGRQVENVNLALLADASFPAGAKAVEQKQAAVRMMRGTIEAAARAMGGTATSVSIEPLSESPVAAFDPRAVAAVSVNGQRIGLVGLIAPGVQAEHGLETPVVAAELSLAALVALYPPRATVSVLPQFPAIERDLSLIVAEETPWAKVEAMVASSKAPLLEGWSFVGAYRGPQAGAGKKSVTLRMRFRDPQRTLTHDQVTPQVETIVGLAKRELGADVRTV